MQQLVEDAYAGRLPEAKASSFTAWNEVVKVDEDVAQDSGSSDDCANSSTANAQKNAFSLDHVILAPPGVHDRNFYASNGLPPLRASGVHGVLWQDLLSGASGRLGGGQGGADLMNSATVRKNQTEFGFARGITYAPEVHLRVALDISVLCFSL